MCPTAGRTRQKLTVWESCQLQGIWLQQNANLSISSKWSTGVWGFPEPGRPLASSAVDIYQANQIQPNAPLSHWQCLAFLFASKSLHPLALHGQKFSAKPRQITCFYTGQIVCCVFCTTINYAGLDFLAPPACATFAYF